MLDVLSARRGHRARPDSGGPGLRGAVGGGRVVDFALHLRRAGGGRRQVEIEVHVFGLFDESASGGCVHLCFVVFSVETGEEEGG